MFGIQPLVLVLMIIEFDQIWICVHFCPLLTVFLSLLIADNLRFFSIALIGTDQKIFIISHNPIAPVPSGNFYLISQVNIIILQQFYRLPVSKGILQIHVESIQQIQVFYFQAFYFQSVKFIGQLFLKFFKGRKASLFDNFSGNALSSKGVSLCFYAAAAVLSSPTCFAAVQAAD